MVGIFIILAPQATEIFFSDQHGLEWLETCFIGHFRACGKVILT
jgi:hypothetical protein